jgi:hypothetical protein
VEERCEASDLLVSQCAHCRPKPARDTSGFGVWITAGFDSDCDGPCGGGISEGDACRSDGEGGWLCRNCGTP